eukprot:Hpha_TRINITY_DN15996_c1_g6::TRINITY_DN15996_c1_g6_i6::g.74433::m.74433
MGCGCTKQLPTRSRPEARETVLPLMNDAPADKTQEDPLDLTEPSLWASVSCSSDSDSPGHPNLGVQTSPGSRQGTLGDVDFRFDSSEIMDFRMNTWDAPDQLDPAKGAAVKVKNEDEDKNNDEEKKVDDAVEVPSRKRYSLSANPPMAPLTAPLKRSATVPQGLQVGSAVLTSVTALANGRIASNFVLPPFAGDSFALSPFKLKKKSAQKIEPPPGVGPLREVSPPADATFPDVETPLRPRGPMAPRGSPPRPLMGRQGVPRALPMAPSPPHLPQESGRSPRTGEAGRRHPQAQFDRKASLLAQGNRR